MSKMHWIKYCQKIHYLLFWDENWIFFNTNSIRCQMHRLLNFICLQILIKGIKYHNVHLGLLFYFFQGQNQFIKNSIKKNFSQRFVKDKSSLLSAAAIHTRVSESSKIVFKRQLYILPIRIKYHNMQLGFLFFSGQSQFIINSVKKNFIGSLH